MERVVRSTFFLRLLMLFYLIMKGKTAGTCSCDNVQGIVKDAIEKTAQRTFQALIEAARNLDESSDDSSSTHDAELGLKADKAAESCKQLNELNPALSSGYYWINPNNPVKVFCESTLLCGGIQGGWMRVADLDMTRPNENCPDNFKLLTESSKRLCQHYYAGRGGCSSVKYSSHQTSYNHVCGKMKALQIGWPISFYYSSRGIDSEYVYGVSLTHGPPGGREHIWTFAATPDSDRHNEHYKCRCTHVNNNAGSTRTPSFIGNDYFCDTALKSYYYNTGIKKDDLVASDPLWDGIGCSSTDTCCDFPGGDVKPPWFHKELSTSTTDDIELRLCRPSLDGSTPLEKIELYVQ